VAYPSCDPPSTLTSGLAVCGNLTAALRGRRRRRGAWTETDIPSALELRENISEASTKFEEEFPVALYQSKLLSFKERAYLRMKCSRHVNV
jgi:hypothetical protein